MSIDSNTLFIQLETSQYPFTLKGVRQQNPNVSIPPAPTEEQLLQLGYAVVTPQPAPEGDVVTEGPPVSVDGVWTQTWEVRAYTPEEVATVLLEHKERLINQINELRDTELVLPYPYEFEPGVLEHIPMQPDDKFNLTHVWLEASQLDSLGDTATLMELRTVENITHYLTPQQMLAALNGPIQRTRTIYRTSWQYKDLIRAVETQAELPELPVTLITP